jgi:hypothetical protein
LQERIIDVLRSNHPLRVQKHDACRPIGQVMPELDPADSERTAPSGFWSRLA